MDAVDMLHQLRKIAIHRRAVPFPPLAGVAVVANLAHTAPLDYERNDIQHRTTRTQDWALAGCLVQPTGRHSSQSLLG